MRSFSLIAVVAGGILLALSPPLLAQADCILDEECSDGDFCNGMERCIGGACASGDPIPCDDADPCTRDFCIPSAGCAHADELCPADCSALADGTRCSDGTVCTVGDTCSGGVCVPGPPPTCPDADECTSAACDPVLGCVYTEEFVSPPCVPSCSGTVADFTPCPGDNNLCTLDACLPSVDFFRDQCVVGLRLSRQCADGNLCNGQEWCSPVVGCQAGPSLQCDDGDPCNGTETCDPGAGCQPGLPLPDGTSCNDGLDCTVADRCTGAACGGTPLTPLDCSDGDPLTEDECREGFGCLNCQALEIGRLKVRLGEAGERRARMRARGTLVAAAGSISPAVEDFVFILDLGGTERYRELIPAGSLVERAPGRFFFRALSAPDSGGVDSVRLSRSRDNRYRWRVAASKLNALGPGETVASVTLLFGARCFSAAATCAQQRNGKVLSCRPQG